MIFKNKKRKKITITVLTVLCSISCGIGGLVNSLPIRAEETTVAGLSPTRLFTTTEDISLQTNVSSPDFMLNGYTRGFNTDVTVKDGYYTRTYTTEDKEEKTEDLRYVPEYFNSGIKATFSKAKSPLMFNNIIDMSKVTKDTSIIQFLPLAASRGTADIKKMTIKIEDAYDSSNYLSFVLSAADDNRRTHFGANTDKIETMAYRHGYASAPITTYMDTVYNTNMGNGGGWAQLPEGATDEEILIEPYSLHIDPTTWSLYISRPCYKEWLKDNRPDKIGNEEWLILSLTDKRVTESKNFFQGFTNDRAKLSITVDTLAGTSADVILYTINDRSLGGEKIVDTIKPDLTVDVPASGLPTAIPNREYKFFDYIATDDLSGQCKTSIYVREPNSYDFVKQTGNTFTPTKEGTYTLRYECIDSFGNTEIQDYSIVSSWTYERLSIIAQEPDKKSYGLGDTIVIPSYEVKGGAGAIQSDYTVTHVATQMEIDVANGQFIPLLVGDYEIKYHAKDYLGDEVKQSLIVNAYQSYGPVMGGTLNVPKTLLNNQKVQLPIVPAYDYDSVVGARTDAKVKITVVGQSGKSITLGEDRLFTPTKAEFGDSVTITYEYYCDKYPDNGLVLPYTCQIKEVNYAADYFEYSPESYNVNYNKDSSASYVRFELKDADDSIVSFINPIYANNFIVNFEIDKAYQQFETVRFTFTDMNNVDIGFSVDVKKMNDTQSELLYMGDSFIFDGGFNRESDNKAGKALGIGYFAGELINTFSKKICTIDKNFDGSEFNGFPSNYCKMSISFVDAGSSAAISIKEIIKQSFYAEYDVATGNMLPFEDSVRPNVSYNFDASVRYKIGDTVSVPMAYGADELSSYMETKVTVTSPNGKKIFDNVLVSEDLLFIVEEYGNYSIQYFTVDAAGNTNKKAEALVKIMDLNSPVVTVNNPNIITGEVGKKVTFPNVTALDDYDKEVDWVIFVVDASTKYYMVDKEQGFIPEKAGEYRVLFYAFDDNNNSAIKEIKMIIKE